MRGLAKTAGERGALELIDVAEPEIGPNEALVEVGYAGLCGSDVGIYKFKDAYRFMAFPRIIGHEYAGTVVEVGDAVARFEPGDRVIEQPIRACGECYQCLSGSPNICQDFRVTGIHHDGAYAKYLAVPQDALHHIPDDLPLREAAAVEPTSIGTRAVIENSRVTAGDRVLVEGPGPIGQLTAQIARRQGAEVVVSGVGHDASYRLPLAADLGFETLTVEDDDAVAEAAAELTDGLGFDVVFDATGHPSGLQGAADAVRKGGQVVLVGITGRTELDFAPLVRSEVDLQCSYASDWEDFEMAVRLVAAGDVDLEPLIDDDVSLLDADAAFEACLAAETCKPVFDVSELDA